MLLSPFFSIGVAAIANWFFLRALVPCLRRRFLDQPNERSSHFHPTPRGAGISFVLLASVASFLGYLFELPSLPVPLSLSNLPLLALPLALVGLLDDLFKLPASLRYIVHFLTALALVFSSPQVVLSLSFLPVLVLLLISVTAVINFTNFMDGLDGLVAGSMAVSMTAIALHLSAPWPIWSLVGSLFGFLLWNWSPAQVFMGDVGSTFLGAVFAGLVLHSSSWSQAFAYVLVATPLLADACFCVPRRLLSGQRVFQAHRLHLYQRLNQAGWSHALVSFTYMSATAVLGLAMIAGGLLWVLGFAVLELLIGVWLDQRVAVPFTQASRI